MHITRIKQPKKNFNMGKNAFLEYRNVKVTFNDAVGQDIIDQTAQIACGIDAYKAALGLVEDLEYKYFQDPTSVSDFTEKMVLVTGTSPYKLHSFDLTTVLASGEYQFVFNETVPNVDDLTS